MPCRVGVVTLPFAVRRAQSVLPQVIASVRPLSHTLCTVGLVRILAGEISALIIVVSFSVSCPFGESLLS